MTTTTRRLTAVAALVLAGSLLAACGDDDDVAAVSGDAPAVTDAADTTDPTEVAEPEGELEVSDAWARTSPAVATAGAAYLEITNGTEVDDVLVGASVDEAVAAKVELHETTEEGGDADMGEGMGGEMGEGTTDTSMAGAPMMQMQPVEDIPVPAGETVSLEPGGLHIMMLDLVEPLEVGTTIEITLTFEQAGDVVVTAEVRDMAP